LNRETLGSQSGLNPFPWPGDDRPGPGPDPDLYNYPDLSGLSWRPPGPRPGPPVSQGFPIFRRQPDHSNDGREGGACGTEGCIWGLSHVIAKAEGISAFKHDPSGLNQVSVEDYGVSSALDRLFFPHRFDSTFSYARVTSRMAVRAIESFMKTGTPRLLTRLI
jgi:hypothetical protein